MNCNCINEVDDKLREKNLKLVGYAFIMPEFSARVQIATDWVSRNDAPKGQKQRPPAMLASFCPFCGKAVQPPSPAPQIDSSRVLSDPATSPG